MAVRRPTPKAPAPAPAKAAPAPAPAAPAEAQKIETPAELGKAIKAAAKAATEPMNADVAGLQANLRTAVSKTIDQSRVAFDRLKEATDETSHSLEASIAATSKGAAELTAKALETMKTNATATFDHLKALAGAKNLSDAISLHGQFIRKQSEAAVEQAKEFAEIAKKAAAETAAPIQKQIKTLTPKS
jgi:phasin